MPEPALALRLFQPAAALTGRWFGPDGRLETLQAARPVAEAVPVVIGPPGARGERGPGVSDPLRLEASLAATWILPNPLGRIPVVAVFLSTGERIFTDVAADAAHITVTFPSPQQGFVLAL
jgi:hypothetical protein